MAITNASRLADFGSGIGTEGAVLQFNNATQRVGIGTTNPQTTLDVNGTVTAKALSIGGQTVSSLGVGGMRKFGLDYETIKKLNPKIIYCSITGFGSQGPLADLPGYDMLVQAMSGLMSITGDSDGEPTKVGVAVIDVIAGLHATTGILAALHSREKSGIGQKVEIDLFSSA